MAPTSLDGWSRDGRWVYFSSTSRDIAGHERRLSRRRWRRHADAGHRRSLRQRVLRRPFAGRPDARVHGARECASSQWWRKGHSHIDESEIWLVNDGPAPVYERVTEGGAKQRGRCGPPTAGRCSSCPIGAARRTSGSRNPESRPRPVTRVHQRPRAVAVDFARRPAHRLRARLRHLDARHRRRGRRRRFRSAAAARRRPRRRAPEPDEPDPGTGALARRQEARVRRARRGVRGLGEGRRRRGSRHDDAGSRVAGDVGAGQPAPRLPVRPRRREPPLPLRLQDRRRDAADAAARWTMRCRRSRPTASRSPSSAASASCG